MQALDVTERARRAVAKLRDCEREKLDAAERLKDISAAIHNIQHNELPDLFAEANLDRLGLPSDGNMPGYDAQLKAFYSANIAAGWDPERRAAAFEALEQYGHGDLIKNTITIQLGRGEHELAERIKKGLDKLGVSYSIGLSVHPQTLTAWLKEQVEAGNQIPPLEVIGATVGTVVKLKEVKPK